MSNNYRIITPQSCVEKNERIREASLLDIKRARFIVKKKFGAIAGSRRLGQIWLVLDPLIMGLVYFFVFTVIRNNPNPVSMFIGITYVRLLQLALRNGFNNGVDYTGGIKIERVRTRVLLMSEYILSISYTFFMCFGISMVFIIYFNTSIFETIMLYLIAYPLYLMWYGLGSMLSPIGVKIPDTKSLVNYFGMLMFFGSPALYSLGQTSGMHRKICLYNPFSYLVEFARAIILDSEDYLLLDVKIGVFYAIIFSAVLIISLIRFDKNRWRYTTWS
jgi:ABC-type polysaccharide/polyol phosphate export permease